MLGFTNNHGALLRRGKLFGLISVAGAAMAFAVAASTPSIAAERPVGVSAAARAAAIQESGGALAVSNQNALSDFRTWIFQQPSFGTSGYVGTIDDLANDGMTVMWYGPSTPLLESIITEGASLGITVSVQPSDYSLQQLTTASQMVFTQAAAGEWAGFQVDAVEALSAADNGLTIDGTYTSVPPADRAPQVNSLTTTIDGVPATIVPGSPAFPTDGRDDDYSPFDAGGFMISNYAGPEYTKGEGCSSGFSLELDGTRYATTARHCIYEYEGSENFSDYVSAD